MEDSRRQEIIAALDAKGIKQPCPRCLTDDFYVFGESHLSLADAPTPAALHAANYIPTVVLICAHCGHIIQHATGGLGLRPGGA